MISLKDDPTSPDMALLAEGRVLNNSGYRMEMSVDEPVCFNLTEEARQRRLELIRSVVEGRK
ncbi:hypothetical protein ZA82_16385 [Salmonella enterica subsp. enterica serovar Enteritidis]|uniref:hypothetical protein n=1 Tax=Citrobacter sp. A316 TaxID=1639132 RepID=UPI0009AD0A12|nr:hypothetical protein [Citrobacter sp. A316]ECG6863255.1 hypothetical protein [Salmonella enterica subsp. enterica serovar Chester]ECN4003640.1 hypothetical protein [Salmonella enterica subsp. enterica serovar Enteritidis]EDV2568480.1 hypothetical protein [Salmonella enterica subsp. enterica serovar Miami]EIJ1114702.1 hypothetical protein [Salmonella enterica subsp. enterica serovar Miami]OPW90912.1 hypothetical protein BZK41_21905 [Citrobacter sp. A316]